MWDGYGEGPIGSIVKKKPAVTFSEVAPPPGSRAFLVSRAKITDGFFYMPGSNLYFLGSKFRLELENFYIRVSYGFWYQSGIDPNTMASVYTFVPDEPASWVSVQAGPDWIEVSCPDPIYEEKRHSYDDTIHTGTISLNYLPKDEYDPPPFPYDPNNPNPPQPSQGVENLYCKVSGQIKQAKQLYTKQNGVIVPVKKIIGGRQHGSI